jgi:hypothetical protein
MVDARNVNGSRFGCAASPQTLEGLVVSQWNPFLSPGSGSGSLFFNRRTSACPVIGGSRLRSCLHKGVIISIIAIIMKTNTLCLHSFLSYSLGARIRNEKPAPPFLFGLRLASILSVVAVR